MNVYDKAYELANLIKESKEYLEFKKVKESVFSNPVLKQKIEEFEKIRYDVQVLNVTKNENNEEKMKKLQELYKILIEDKEIKNFFDKQVCFNVMLADINKIIAVAVKDVLN